MKKFGIVLDPGHGGSDPGAVVGKYKEKDLNLAVMWRLREYMKQYASGILVTRDKDEHVSLTRRIWLANHARSILEKRGMPVDEVLYLSIHWNGADREAHGGEVWYNPYGKEHAGLIRDAYKGIAKWRRIKDARYWKKDKNGRWVSIYIVHIRRPAILWEVGFTGYDFTDDLEYWNHEWHVKIDSDLDHLIEKVARNIYDYYLHR